MTLLRLVALASVSLSLAPAAAQPSTHAPGASAGSALQAGDDQEVRNTSGGPLIPEQAAYDVEHYRLTLSVDPARKSIRGVLTMTARVVQPSGRIALDLDRRLKVSRISSEGRKLVYEHDGDRIWIADQALCQQPGETFEVSVTYGGRPRVAPRPPWSGGFTWAKTADGSPWIATSCQGEGADLWWPCKDHPSDEPDGMDLLISVPDPLVVASNGQLATVMNENGWSTYHWRVTTPINNYGVALNIAPYETISADYTSVAGDTFPITYWVLPENLEQGKILFEDILLQMRFFEEVFGPYPFRGDKYGVAETPHLGMEHQSIIAYGNEYQGNPWGKDRGFDFLHHHEAAHEWWANLVTVRDWSDMWIHEGFGSYAQDLYVEKLFGKAAYLEEIEARRKGCSNRAPVAPRRTMNTREVYFGGDGSDSPGGDIYGKGALVLHTLRWQLGDAVFFRCLRRMAYPDPALEATTDGSACRLVDTDDFLAICERESGQDLDWFFELYLRQPALPALEHELEGSELVLRWTTPGDLPSELPVPVRVGEDMVRVAMPGGTGRVALGPEGTYAIDPDRWLVLTR